MPGPVPKRSEQRRRTNKPDMPVAKAERGTDGVIVPYGDPDWHPIAKDWYASLLVSGQAAFYEASDWHTARYVAEAMSKNLLMPKFSSMLFSAVLTGMSSLLATEGDRRRLKIELQRHIAVDRDEEAAEATVRALQSRIAG